ncbi:MAG: methionyl-tRNA formyltransferase [Aestuariivirga sp.]
MRLIFMGTPDFAVATLRALLAAGHEVVCVYSQPPRPAGRGMALKPSPVQIFAEAQVLEVRHPTSLKSPEEQMRFAALEADAAVVVAYGLLLPKAVLDAPKFGCFNVHASLLPRWRGAAPIQRAIMAGDAETGVTIMRMEEGLDTGPMMKVERMAITSDATAASLHDELAEVGARAMVKVLKDPMSRGKAQPDSGVTYAKKIDKAEAHIDLSKTSVEVRNHIHGLSPFPGAWCMLNDARIKVLKAQTIDRSEDEPLNFACGQGAIKFLSLQREGKGVMDAATFLRGFPLPLGTRPE